MKEASSTQFTGRRDDISSQLLAIIPLTDRWGLFFLEINGAALSLWLEQARPLRTHLWLRLGFNTVARPEENHLQFLVPQGFAHGFSVLSETAIFSYKCDDFYNPALERGIMYNDPALNIDWKIPADKALISEKILNIPYLFMPKKTSEIMNILITNQRTTRKRNAAGGAVRYPQFRSYIFTDIDELDICDKRSRSFVKANAVDVIVNCGGLYGCQIKLNDVDLCYKINRDVTETLALV